MRFGLWAAAMISGVAIGAAAQSASEELFGDGRVHMVIRCDDIGFCHAVNQAFERVASRGMVTAASVIVTTPWLDEAVEILNRHPEVSVGVHLCLNSEWLNFRWGPVLGPLEVPSLVNEFGEFWPTRALFNAHDPQLDEIERELRAQVALAQRKGLHLSYIDHHMGTAGETPERQAILERIARDNGIGISRWFGEQQPINIYDASPEDKADSLVEQLGEITDPGLYLLVAHVGLNQPEMRVLRDAHPWAPHPVAVYREAEMNALLDPRVSQMIDDRGIELVGYNTIRDRFLDHLQNPNYEVLPAPPTASSATR